MDPFFIRIFWFTVGMLWIALIALYFILTNRRSLERKGYSEEYIAYLRRSHTIRIIIIALVLPLLILLSAFIVAEFTGDLKDESQLAYIIVLMIILVVPFKIIDESIHRRKIRELALQTHEKVAIDLNYKILHLVFNPYWELILGISSLVYGVLFLRIEPWIIYVFLIFPWLLYINIRGTRYQTRPFLKDNYKYLFSFSLFSYLFFLFYFGSYFMIRLKFAVGTFKIGELEDSEIKFPPTTLILIIGFLIMSALIVRIALYASNYRIFNKMLKGESTDTRNVKVRRYLFIIPTLIIMFIIIVTGLIRDNTKVNRTDVGIVKKKYLIENGPSGSAGDTLAVIDRQGIHYLFRDNGKQVSLKVNDSFIERDLKDRLNNHELQMVCAVENCRTNRLRYYTVCCPCTFDQLPVETIVKFEYDPEYTIVGLVE